MTTNGWQGAIGQLPRITSCIVILLLLWTGLVGADQRSVLFDAARLRTGTFIYRSTGPGQRPSLSTSMISRLPDGTYRFVADIPAFHQGWTTIATRSLAPVSTQLKMLTRDHRHYRLTLNYSGRSVTGEAVLDSAVDERHQGADQPVTGRVTADTVDQRIDWAAAMSTNKPPGDSFDFEVYDAKTALSRIHCEVRDAGIMDTPEGKTHAIRIDYTVRKATGTETYTVYTTAAFPRIMLREEMRGDLEITLVGIRHAGKRDIEWRRRPISPIVSTHSTPVLALPVVHSQARMPATKRTSLTEKPKARAMSAVAPYLASYVMPMYGANSRRSS